MAPETEKRHHRRVNVQWPTVFYTAAFFGHGTVVDVSALAWRVRGSVPLQAGMRLAVLVWPHQFGYLEIEEAIVLWAHENEFAIEIYQVRQQDEPAMVKLQEQTVGQNLQQKGLHPQSDHRALH